jgi:hypothetical protein
VFYISWSNILCDFNRSWLEAWRERLEEVLMPFERRGFKPLKPTKIFFLGYRHRPNQRSSVPWKGQRNKPVRFVGVDEVKR